jgi:hypothetical protein
MVELIFTLYKYKMKGRGPPIPRVVQVPRSKGCRSL